MGEMDRSALRLVFVSPGDRSPERTARLIESVLAGGVSAVWLRERQLEADALRALAERTARLVSRTGARLILSRDVDLAVAVGAWGVHLGWGGPDVDRAREHAGNLLVGRSAHWPLQAQDGRADYVTLSPFRSTPASRPRPRLTPEQIGAARRVLPGPIVALGGIDRAAIPELPEGLAGVAVLRALSEAADPERAAATLRAAVERRWPTTEPVT